MSFQPQPVYGPPGYYAAPAPLRPRTLGAVSMGIALGVFVLSVAASVYVGMTAGPLMHRTAGTAYTVDSTNLSQAQLAAFAPIGVLMGAQMLFGTVLGILAIVLGIIAAATKRGRAFGVVGIAVATAAPVLSFIAYTVTVAASTPHA